MSLDADAIVDRRRLKRRLALWRAVAVLSLTGALLFGIWQMGLATMGGEHIVQLDIAELLMDDPDRTAAVRRLAEDKMVQALIVRIDSPGGTVVAAETLYHALRHVASEKPVVAVIAGTGASAGYLIALAADYIFARESSVTGSIGVLIQTGEISELLSRLGISAEAIKSSELKDQLSPLEPITPEARTATQAVVNDIYRWFVDLVANRRGLSPAAALQLADGRVFSGRQAAALELIDGLGGLPEARNWLMENHGLGRDLPVHTLELRGHLSIPAQLLGFARKTLFSEALRLDGLLSLWHPNSR